MATTNAAKILAVAALAALAAIAPADAQQRPASIYTVANVRAEAEAENAVEAKRLATETAETRAFELLVSRLADFRVEARIPDLPAAELERVISNIDVRAEGVSGTSYVATFGVTFSERGLAQLLGQHGVIPVTDRGPEILIVPVYVEGGNARTADRNPWRAALADLDLTHALVPAKVAPARGDITAAIAAAYIANPPAGLDTLKSQYRTTQILFALAELDGGGDALTLKLIGSDALGAFALKRTFQPREGVDETALQAAARLAFETVQERWKLTRGSFVAASAEPSAGGAGRLLPNRRRAGAGPGDGGVLRPEGMAGDPRAPAERPRHPELGREVREPAQRGNRLRLPRRRGTAGRDRGAAGTQRGKRPGWAYRQDAVGPGRRLRRGLARFPKRLIIPADARQGRPCPDIAEEFLQHALVAGIDGGLALDEVEHLAVLQAIIRDLLDVVLVVEIHRDDAPVGHFRSQERHGLNRRGGNIIERAAANRGFRIGRSERERDLLLAHAFAHLAQVFVLELVALADHVIAAASRKDERTRDNRNS